MGNRCVITTNNSQLGVYLHWNGGRDSVEAFLKYCELKGYPSPERDCYGWARLCQVIGNFFGGSTSIGIDAIDTFCQDEDNGTYIIKDWQIVGRIFRGREQREYKLEEMLQSIDERQPKDEQLGEFLTAPRAERSNLKIGDKVYIKLFDDSLEIAEIIGIGKDEVVNGRNVKDLPFVNKYGYGGDYSKNPNNYLRAASYRLAN